MRCVFDTNVLVSALLSPGSTAREAFNRARRMGNLLLSAAVLAEVHDVLSRDALRRYIDEGDLQDFLAALVREAEWVDPDVDVVACRDPKDDKFLTLAVAGQATYIVTGDRDLLVLDPFQQIRIVSPRMFLESQ